MQEAIATGLVSALEAERRCSIVCVHGAAETYKKALVEQWSNCDSKKAHDRLSVFRLKVTNRSDKRVRLCALATVDATAEGDNGGRVEGVGGALEGLFSGAKSALASSWCARYGA